ncbi:MAG: hypothetical protein C0390_11420 [Syntrophus sp. (in: bacteria)]|nr:hypothetical protein [Syntrophus sp. (in: bacteria)]
MVMLSKKVGSASHLGRLRKKLQRQGARLLRNEAYSLYAAVTREEAQRSIWAFCGAANGQ